MPPENGVTITPRPAHRSFRTPNAMSDRRGTFILTFMILTVLVASFLSTWNAGPTGSVSLLVRSMDGERVVETIELRSGVGTVRTDVDANSITTLSARRFTLRDGSTITLNAAGVVRRAGTGAMSVLIASPVEPLLRTPLAVWDEGSQIAWMSPADGSVQVFQRTERGTYVPVYLNNNIQPNSLGFTEDGSTLVAALIMSEYTELYAIELTTGEVTMVSKVPGLASIVPTP